MQTHSHSVFFSVLPFDAPCCTSERRMLLFPRRNIAVKYFSTKICGIVQWFKHRNKFRWFIRITCCLERAIIAAGLRQHSRVFGCLQDTDFFFHILFFQRPLRVSKRGLLFDESEIWLLLVTPCTGGGVSRANTHWVALPHMHASLLLNRVLPLQDVVVSERMFCSSLYLERVNWVYFGTGTVPVPITNWVLKCDYNANRLCLNTAN